MKKPELLSPAGDMECLKTAFRFGADAVYVGGPLLQLRADNVGFSRETLKDAVEYTHGIDKKIYVTVNSSVRQGELDELKDYLLFLKEIDVDGVIVSDLGVISVINKYTPGLPIHISTQANCQNSEAVMMYRKLGAVRVVTAREMTLDEIREMKKCLPDDFEIEAFVHGAMCMAYSGRCYISSMLNDRSSNRGECSQPCRWSYHLMENKRPGEFFPVEETKTGTNILSSRDLNCISFIDELYDAGVSSFKIEGRMKTPYYVATVTNAYRRGIDHSAPLELLEIELNAVSHRPYCKGFYFGGLKKYNPDKDLPYIRECNFIGTVVEVEDNRVLVEQRGKFSTGDILEIVSPNSIGLSFKVDFITDTDGNKIECAPHAMQKVWINRTESILAGDLLRCRINNELQRAHSHRDF